MPQICRFLGVNSVTNIELPKGFMPALICIFEDWLENFSTGDSARELPVKPGRQGGVRPPILKQSGLLPLTLRLVAFCRFARAGRHKVGEGGDRGRRC